MVYTIRKFRVFMVVAAILIISTYLYIDKPYSNYDINHIKEIDNKKIEEIKDYYFKNINISNDNNKYIKVKKIFIKKNQTLGLILGKLNISTPRLILKKFKSNCLYKINVKDEIIIKLLNKKLVSIKRKNKNIECLYESNNNKITKITKTKNNFKEQLVFFNNISNSFYNSAIKSGLSPNEIMLFADIFGWDIDFSLDIRKGDSFGVVLERIYSNGKKYDSSTIKYAVFKNKNKIIEAFRYNNKYYNKKGTPLEKQFLKAPIDFYRISSHFNRKRLHPIFKSVRPHLGTDYAAPKGTPVYSTGDGIIIHKGRKGGYGKAVIIKHGNIYTTLYGHLSKYHKRIRAGKRVKQKQIIGYVGSTGYATGPHVHYEFRVRGVHKNSLKIKFKKGKKLSKKNINKLKKIHQTNINKYTWLRKNYIK